MSIKERLLRTKTEHAMRPLFGSLGMPTGETREVLINPDGADAVRYIEALEAELAPYRKQQEIKDQYERECG